MAGRRSRGRVTTDDDMQACKFLFGHAWYPYEAERRDIGWAEVVVCDRCGSTRRSLLDPDGTVHSRAYGYVDGYRDAGHWDTKADARAAYYASTTADELKERRSRRARKAS